MHHYRRNIGDYAKKAGRLSILQHGVYNLLIDACYDREEFPTRDEAIDWVWASTDEEITAVDFVLRKFFDLQDDGKYIQKRILEELEEYWKHCEKQAENGKKGGRPKKPSGLDKKPSGFSEEPSGNPVETQNPLKKSLTTNHQPLTTNQEPRKHSRGFTPPEREEVLERIKEMGYRYAKADDFINFYASKGWMVGKNKMTDWKRALAGWESRKKSDAGCQPSSTQRAML